MTYLLQPFGLVVTAVLLGSLKGSAASIQWMSRNYTTALKVFSILKEDFEKVVGWPEAVFLRRD